jgi:V/A-type H+-transporting ATPase subunit B
VTGIDDQRSPMPVEYTVVSRVDGPLVVVERVSDVGWDETVAIELPSGEVRHGVVVDVDADHAIVEVFEGTGGVGTDGNRITFLGRPLTIAATDRWLGRVCNGRGDPIDGGPPVLGGEQRSANGAPINPAKRDVPLDAVITGVSAIDALTTLVRGQKLPIFSVGGLPHLELATQIAAQAHVGDSTLVVVFAGMGITHADAAIVRGALEDRVAAGEAVLFLNTADDPVMERIMTPRLALTVAEHLAFDLDRHVLVILTDMTAYCDAVRQLSSARGEIPSRRGYPGYLFTDLASIYERCGRLTGRAGSITEVPVLTMPSGDITHPVPDLTGYITEGQIVLDADMHAKGIYPPVDALSSLSRLMRRGAGPGRTREDHLDVAAQLVSLRSQARQAQDLAELIGIDALSVTERRYLDFATAFEQRLIDQGPDENRSLDDTLTRAWDVLSTMPERELTMINPAYLKSYHHGGIAGAAPSVDEDEERPR